MEEWHQKIGHLLALERQRRSIEVDEVAADLKITVEHLVSIEVGDPKALPSPLYFDLFAKSYAEYLGIDYAATVRAIREQLEEIEQPDPDKKSARTDERKHAHAGKQKSRKSTPKEDGESESNRNAALRKLAWIVGGAIALLLIFLVINALWLNPGNPDSGLAQPEDEIATQVEVPAEVAPGGAASIEWRLPPQGPPAPLVVRLQARQRSWTEILTDGDTAWQGNLNPGSWVEETAQYRTEISVGVPEQVDVTINGDTVDLRNAKRRIYMEDVNQLNLVDVLAGKRPFETSNIEITTAEALQAAQQIPASASSQKSASRQPGEPASQSSEPSVTPGRTEENSVSPVRDTTELLEPADTMDPARLTGDTTEQEGE